MAMKRRDFMKACAGAAAFGTAGLWTRALADPPALDDSYQYQCPDLVEITEPGPVILPDGSCRCGWTRRPILDLNFDAAQFASRAKMRQAMKKWDMYHLYTPEYAMQFLVAWIPYAAFFNANIYDRATGALYEDTRFLPASPEIPMLPDSTRGRTAFVSDDASAVFEVNGEHHHITVDFRNFSLVDKEKADTTLGGSGNAPRTAYRVDIDMLYPRDHDSIAGVHPTNARRCHYGHKINCMAAQGTVTFRDKTSALRPADSFGALDFGRGHYPRKMFWYWATASGRLPDGRLMGFNLGLGNSRDNRTENALFVDGRITKVDRTDSVAPSDGRLMDPWSVKDRAGLVDLTFTPQKVRRVDVTIGSGYSRGRPSLGLFTGRIKTADGETINIKDLFGLYEWVDSKW